MTMGDPAGVGPEVCLKAARVESVLKKCVPLIVGDMAVLRKHARKMEIPARLERVKDEGALAQYQESALTPVIDLKNVASGHRVFGKVISELGAASGRYIEKAVSIVRSGRADAVATAPINKESLQAGGYDYPGHTEMLAALCGEGRPVMMLAHRKIRIAHLSTHCPLRVALRRVKRKRIVYVAQVLDDALRLLDQQKNQNRRRGLESPCGRGRACSAGRRRRKSRLRSLI